MNEKKDYVGEELRKERETQEQKYAQQVGASAMQQNAQNTQAAMQAAMNSGVPEYILLRAKVAELKDRLTEAVAAEREACAKIAENHPEDLYCPRMIAAAIRARGAK